MASEKSVTIKVPDFDLWKTLTLLALVLVVFNLYLTLQLRGDLTGGTLQTTPTITTGNTGSTGSQQPSRVQVDIKDEPYLGNKDAKVVVVEFTDFQCPFCRRAFDNTFPTMKSEYIDTGKVLYVVRDFPLPFHQEADEAAEAANCAGDQGLDKYWEMHDLLFVKQDEWAYQPSPYDKFKGYATDLGLDASTFNNCIDSGKYKNEIQADLSDGSGYGVSGTPTFYIGNLQDGFVEIIGAQPYSVFKQAIDQELGKV